MRFIMAWRDLHRISCYWRSVRWHIERVTGMGERMASVLNPENDNNKKDLYNLHCFGNADKRKKMNNGNQIRKIIPGILWKSKGDVPKRSFKLSPMISWIGRICLANSALATRYGISRLSKGICSLKPSPDEPAAIMVAAKIWQMDMKML